MPIQRVALLLLSMSAVTWGADRFRTTRPTRDGVEIIRLEDTRRGVVVSVAPSLGNRAIEFSVHGNNLLYFPITDLRAFQTSGAHELNGIPFLAPWANRLAGGGFWADGKRYLLNGNLGTVQLDRKGIAIHGMLTSSSLWEVTDVHADEESARVTSRLRFWRDPALLANWPFSHEYTMTYTLRDNSLEVSTAMLNRSDQPMPISIGYHPYFQIPGIDRSEASIHLPVRRHVETDRNLVATGTTTAANLSDRVSLRTRTFDDGYTDLVREPNGDATFVLEARDKKIEVAFGPKYQVAVIYAPPGKPFVCFEPMTAITNGINLAHAGKYDALKSMPPGGVWQEHFSIHFSGF